MIHKCYPSWQVSTVIWLWLCRGQWRTEGRRAQFLCVVEWTAQLGCRPSLTSAASCQRTSPSRGRPRGRRRSASSSDLQNATSKTQFPTFLLNDVSLALAFVFFVVLLSRRAIVTQSRRCAFVFTWEKEMEKRLSDRIWKNAYFVGPADRTELLET